MVVRVVRVALVIAVAACGSSKRPAGEDAMRGARDGSAAPADTGSGSGSAAPTGEVAVRVEWRAVPTSARQSPGTTPCNTPRAPAVTPTTMWGIPEAMILAEKAPAPGTARITIAGCALTPRIVVARELIVDSALDRPTKVMLVKHGTIAALGALQSGEARTIQLPIAGHAVMLSLDANAVYRLGLDSPDGEVAWIVNAPGLVTDVTGLATLALPAGKHDVTAWLPARGGQEWKVVKSNVTVEASALVELAIDLGPR